MTQCQGTPHRRSDTGVKIVGLSHSHTGKVYFVNKLDNDNLSFTKSSRKN